MNDTPTDPLVREILALRELGTPREASGVA